MRPTCGQILLYSGLLAVSLQAGAETLEDAWNTALAAHHKVASASAMREAAGYNLARARSARLPQVGVSGTYTWLDAAPGFSFGDGLSTGPLFDGDKFLAAGAQLSLPLYAGGGINSGIAAAEHGADEAARSLAAIRQDIKLGAAELYVAVLRAERAVEVADTYARSLATHARYTKDRFEFGDVPQNDYLAASVTLADAEQRLLQARNALDYSRAAYNRFMGRPLSAEVALDPTVDMDALVPAGASLEELTRAARVNRHELAAFDSRTRALLEEAERARARVRPQLTLSGGYMYLENSFLTDDEFWMAGLSLRWNLFDGGQARKRSAALEQESIAVGHDRQEAESLIALQVRRTWNDRLEAENRLAVAENAVAQAQENLRVVRNRYQAGASINTEVLDAEALSERSLSNLDNARFEVALAKLRMARAIGAL